MNPRLTTALLCGVAAAMLVAAALSSRWLVADIDGFGAHASLRIGLTSLRVCATSLVDAGCREVSWSELPGGVDGGTWMWLGRLTFAMCWVAALGLVALGGLAVAEVELRLGVPLPRIVMWPCLALVPLQAGYYLMPPSALSELAAGRGFALGLIGALAGAFAAWRQLRDE